MADVILEYPDKSTKSRAAWQLYGLLNVTMCFELFLTTTERNASCDTNGLSKFFQSLPPRSMERIFLVTMLSLLLTVVAVGAALVVDEGDVVMRFSTRKPLACATAAGGSEDQWECEYVLFDFQEATADGAECPAWTFKWLLASNADDVPTKLRESWR